jgi:hypothetical protein
MSTDNPVNPQLATEELWEKVMGLLNERVPLRP